MPSVHVPYYSFPLDNETWLHPISYLQPHHVNNDEFIFNEKNIFSTESQINFDCNFANIKNLIIGVGVVETHAGGDRTYHLQKTIENFEKIFINLENIYIFNLTSHFDVTKIVSKSNIHVRIIKYCLLRSRMTDLKQFSSWKIGNKKAIFLPGTISGRPHKFPLLYYFYKQNKLDLLYYSLKQWPLNTDFQNCPHLKRVLEILNNDFDAQLTQHSFRELFYKLSKNLSNDPYEAINDYYGISMHTHLYPIQWNLATCNILCESHFYNLKSVLNREVPGHEKFYFSEKMYKPLLSNKPFIACSYNDEIYTQLEELGFKTFLEYTDYPNKLEIHTSTKSKPFVKLCFDRVTSFLKNCDKYEKEILSDTMHNKKRWLELSKNEWEANKSFCPPIKHLSLEAFCEIFNYPSYVEKFYKLL